MITAIALWSFTNLSFRRQNFIKHIETVKINLKEQITSLLLEEDVLIAASYERFIRFVDLSSNKERFSIDLKETKEFVRKIIFSMQDQLVSVALQRKLKVKFLHLRFSIIFIIFCICKC